ncbi:MAG: hypothetical protein AAGH15_27980, partial [Myxococcota bacterium]
MIPRVLVLALLAACASRPDAAPAESGEETATSGGETAPLRATIPVPVPAPPVAREALSAEARTLWTRVEETVAIRPPDPPTDGTLESVNAWAQSVFAAWVDRRGEATRALEALGEAVPEAPVHERVVGAALYGYALEDFASGVRGAPIPEEIATDAELLDIYEGALEEQVGPLARQA